MTITRQTYTGDGSTVLFTFAFPYVVPSDVVVEVNSTITPQNSINYPWSFANSNTIQFVTAPPTGINIEIYRDTNLDEVVYAFYPGSSIRAKDLNVNFDQILYVAQESRVLIENADAGSVSAIANQALSTANQAEFTANSISGTAQSALTTSQNAETTAQNAETIAQNAETIANALVGTAKIENNAVNADKLATDAVTTIKIENNAVNANKLATNAVTTIKIENNAVTTAKLADSNVTTAKIADDAVTVAKLDPAIIFVPTGAITAFGGSTAPTGYLECNGQSTAGYAALAAVVGANVPDLRGEFVRGWDNGRGVDAGRALGSTQADQFQDHTHAAYVGSSPQGGTGSVQSNAIGTITTSVASSGNSGTETRPRNVALMYIIKT